MPKHTFAATPTTKRKRLASFRSNKECGVTVTLIAGWSVNSEDQPKRDIGQFEWMLAEEVRAGLPESIRVYYDHWKAAHTA